MSDLETAFTHFITAFNAQDWPRLSQLCEPELSLFAPNQARRLDGGDAAEYFQTAFATGAPSPNIQPQNLQMQNWGETALLTFEFARGTGTLGRRSLVWRKQGESWKLVHIHASNLELI